MHRYNRVVGHGIMVIPQACEMEMQVFIELCIYRSTCHPDLRVCSAGCLCMGPGEAAMFDLLDPLS